MSQGMFCPLGRTELHGNEGFPAVGERVVQVGSKQLGSKGSQEQGGRLESCRYPLSLKHNYARQGGQRELESKKILVRDWDTGL